MIGERPNNNKNREFLKSFKKIKHCLIHFKIVDRPKKGNNYVEVLFSVFGQKKF